MVFLNFTQKTLACQYFSMLNYRVAPQTSNLYGKITITKKAINQVVLAATSSVVGIARVKGSDVACEKNRIDVNVRLYLKFGMMIDPVIESTRRAIKYNVETFTGMTVERVNIDVLGIRN
jgi:uncharacterized alkaline shock family protein YloU